MALQDVNPPWTAALDACVVAMRVPHRHNLAVPYARLPHAEECHGSSIKQDHVQRLGVFGSAVLGVCCKTSCKFKACQRVVAVCQQKAMECVYGEQV